MDYILCKNNTYAGHIYIGSSLEHQTHQISKQYQIMYDNLAGKAGLIIEKTHDSLD